MRTYSRKRVEHSVLENVTDLCRLCLEKPDEFVLIYSEDPSVFSSLALRILICAGLEISNDEQLPNKICTQCHAEIDKIYLFRKKCANSYQKLKSHIQALKARETRKSPNLVFTLNFEGNILPKNGNNSIFTDDEALATLTKTLNDESKATNTEVLQNKCGVKPKNVLVEECTIDSNKLLDKVADQEIHPMLIQSCGPSPSLAKEVVIVPKTETSSDPELSEFLSTMLTELGILTRHADGVIDLGPKTSRTLELETKDGNNVTFELVEEGNDEMDNDAVPECVIENRITTAEEEVVSSAKCNNWRKIVKCAECGKMFRNRGVLARHERNVHKRLRPHVCPTCGKKFAQKAVMARHILVHLENRPFQCDKCSKSFTQRGALEIHSRLHRPPQDRSLTLYKCHHFHCHKVFFYASGLSRHLLSHRNMEISCGECGRKFSDKSSLRRHEKTMGHQSKEAVEDNENETLPKTDSVQQQSKPNQSALSSSDTGG